MSAYRDFTLQVERQGTGGVLDGKVSKDLLPGGPKDRMKGRWG